MIGSLFRQVSRNPFLHLFFFVLKPDRAEAPDFIWNIEDIVQTKTIGIFPSNVPWIKIITIYEQNV